MKMLLAGGECPFLDEGMAKWIIKTARREHWRVSELCDLEELIQDGYMAYAKCYDRYIRPGTYEKVSPKDDQRWFQSLVKRTFENHIHSLAAKHRDVSVSVASQLTAPDEGVEGFLERVTAPESETASLSVLLSQAPQEIRDLLALLGQDARDVVEFQRRRLRHRFVRETHNERFCRLLGLNPDEVDMVGKLRQFFGVSM